MYCNTNEQTLNNNNKSNKTLIKVLIAVWVIVAILGLALGIFFIVKSTQKKDSDKKSTNEDVIKKDTEIDIKENEIVIKGNVVYVDGEVNEDKPIVQYAKPEKGDVIAKIKIKNYGTLVVRFFPEHAPLAVENFLTHAKEGYYDGLTFHRIIDDFMIQGGDPEGNGTGGESIWTNDYDESIPFTDEYSLYLMPIRGALCMANAGSNTNGSQFFIVQSKEYIITDVMDLRSKGVDGDLIDYYKENGGAGWLYGKHTVFGQIIEGYDVLDEIAGVNVNSNKQPEKDVIIETIELDVY